MRFPVALPLLLAACAPQPGIETPAPAPSAMEFHISSWGRTVSAWKIAPDGAATYTHAEGPGFGTRLITRKFDAGATGFAQIRKLLAPAERAAAAPPECGERWTDFPYGAITWIAAAGKTDLAFDLGCHNSRLKPVHDALGKASKQMEAWSRGGQVIEDREMNQ